MANANAPLPTIQQNNTVQILSPFGATGILGTTSALVIGPDVTRRGVRFFNPGTVMLYICPSNIPAVVGQGIPIFPGGGPVDMIGDGKLINYNCGWNGIAASGSSNPITLLVLF